jgi:S1-C subfamily serine protease
VLTAAFSRCAPSVAYIDVFLESPSADGLRVRVPRGTGSGFVWDEQGRVVTNYHVVRGYVNPALPASASPAPPASPGPPSAALRKALLGNPVIEVTVGSQTLRASVVGFDVDKDIAVLQLPPFDPATRLPRAFPPIERLHGSFERLGSEGAAVEPLPLLVGQTALAIGAPYGLSQSLSVGIISGLNRSFRSPSGRLVTGCIQTDCAVNPGNSGGPLLSSAGTLIGMTSAIESPTGASAGIAFAVPYDALSYVVSLLIKYGKVRARAKAERGAGARGGARGKREEPPGTPRPSRPRQRRVAGRGEPPNPPPRCREAANARGFAEECHPPAEAAAEAGCRMGDPPNPPRCHPPAPR